MTTSLISFMKNTADQAIILDIMTHCRKYRTGWIFNFTMIDLLNNTITYNNDLLFDKLMKEDIDINIGDSSNNLTPIMYAAQRGNYRMLKALLKKGARVDIGKISALYFVLDKNNRNVVNYIENLKCAEKLIKAGSNIELLREKCKYEYGIGIFIKQKLMKNESSQEIISQENLPAVIPQELTLKNNTKDESSQEIISQELTLKNNTKHESESNAVIVKLFPESPSSKKIGILTRDARILLKDEKLVIKGDKYTGYKLPKGTCIEISSDQSICHILPKKMQITKFVDDVAQPDKISFDDVTYFHFMYTLAVNIKTTINAADIYA